MKDFSRGKKNCRNTGRWTRPAGHDLKTVHWTVFFTVFRRRFAPPHQLHRDGITVIDLSTNSETKKIKTGLCPVSISLAPQVGLALRATAGKQGFTLFP